ncbi:hypothetical protein J2R96_005344 [Bradyrhizobium elkanii]|nr:hypothetical protein [Bradyrhizobium elkanii]
MAAAEDREFRIRPGGICSSTSQRARRFIAQAIAAAQRVGGQVPRSDRIITGNRSRLGRGRIASVPANHLLTGRSCLVVIKTRVIRHIARAAPFVAHLNYLHREGGRRHGQGAAVRAADRGRRRPCPRGARAAVITSVCVAEDAAAMADLKSFARELMGQVAKDLLGGSGWLATC